MLDRGIWLFLLALQLDAVFRSNIVAAAAVAATTTTALPTATVTNAAHERWTVANDDQLQHYASSSSSSSLRGGTAGVTTSPGTAATTAGPTSIGSSSSSKPKRLIGGGGVGRSSSRKTQTTYSWSSCSGSIDNCTYNYNTGQWEQKETTQWRVSIPLIPVFFLLIMIAWCCCKIRADQEEQARQQLAMQQEQQLRHQAAEQATLYHQATGNNNNNNNNGPLSQPLQLSRLVTAVANKSSPDLRWGVAFVGTDHARITRILPDSIFHGTQLEPGMKIVSINNIPINSTMHAVEVLTAVKNVVTIIAHSAGYYGSTDNLVTASIVKERREQPVGVLYKMDVSNGPVRLGAFPESSLFRSPTSSSHGHDLTVGMEVVAVNNVPVQSITEAAELTRTAFPYVTILARRSAAVAVLAVADATATAANSDNIVVTAEPVASYALSSRDDPIVATATATPITTSDQNDNNDTRTMEL